MASSAAFSFYPLFDGIIARYNKKLALKQNYQTIDKMQSLIVYGQCYRYLVSMLIIVFNVEYTTFTYFTVLQ